MATGTTSDGRRVVYRSANSDQDPVYASAYDPAHPYPTIIRSADVPDPSRRVVVRNGRNPQSDYGPVYADDYRGSNLNNVEGNRQVYVVRRPTGRQALSPDRAPPVYIENSQALAPQVIYSKSTTQTSNPGRGYYTQRGTDDDDEGCFACCPSSSSSEKNSAPGMTAWDQMLQFFTKYICWIITIALFVLAIAVACIIICAVYLGLNSSSNYGLKIAGIIIGSILAVGATVFLFFVLCCLGKEDGLFSYFGKRQRIGGGQAYALMPPPNGVQYTQSTGQPYTISGRNTVYPSEAASQRPYIVTNGNPNQASRNNNIVVKMN